MKLKDLQYRNKFSFPKLNLDDESARKLIELGIFPDQTYQVLGKNLTGSIVVSNDFITVGIDYKIASSLVVQKII